MRVIVFTGVCAIVLLSFGFFGASPASADDPATPSGSNGSAVSPAPAAGTPNPVVITAPTTDTFFGKNSVTVSGSADSGSTVGVSATPGGSSCTAITTTTTPTTDNPNPPGSWSCKLDSLPNGSAIELTASQAVGGATSTGPITINVLGPPTLDGPGSFVTPGIVSGGAFTGATVTVLVNGSGGKGCTTVAVNSYWSCSMSAPSGGPYTVTAQQSKSGIGGPSDQSAAQWVTVDKTRPAAPVVTFPKAGSRVLHQPITFSGTGEAMSFLNVYVDTIPVCGGSSNAAGVWTCTATGIADGVHAVQAIQADLAGNYSDPSAPIRVYFGQKATVASSAPPVTPTSPPPTPPAPQPTPSVPAQPFVPGSGGTPPTLHEALTNWGTPTLFGSFLPTVADTVSHGSWVRGPLLAIAFILLVALPLRMLATTFRGRFHRPRTRLTGRNQVIPRTDDTATRHPWLVGVVPLAAASGFILVSVGFNGEVRFVRLLVAVGAGLAILNVLCVAVVTRATSLAVRVSGRLKFLPMMLVAAAVSAILSRTTGLEPPVVTGVLIGVGFAGIIPARHRAIVNLAEVGSITVLAVLAWFTHSALGTVDGFWLTFSSETLATLCLAGLGSALILMLPVATLPGRVILEWSPVAWLVAIAVVATLTSVIVLGGSGTPFPVAGSLLVAGGFAALSLAAWSWVRFVEPAVDL
ncbi:MAG: hypothetical protein JWM70_1079 [Microbacteriaceae bacterium]|nr:hypothetical protein [Microbacteriaceae bacterium]